jgi:hypothetical protein
VLSGGSGVVVYPNGDEYIGEWNNNKLLQPSNNIEQPSQDMTKVQTCSFRWGSIESAGKMRCLYDCPGRTDTHQRTIYGLTCPRNVTVN